MPTIQQETQTDYKINILYGSNGDGGGGRPQAGGGGSVRSEILFLFFLCAHVVSLQIVSLIYNEIQS